MSAPVTKQIYEHAKNISADCIFIGADMMAHGQEIGRGLSKVAQSIVLGAPCSVEILRPGEHWKPAA